MADRRAELEKKKQKLAEIRAAREEARGRSQALSQSATQVSVYSFIINHLLLSCALLSNADTTRRYK